MVSFQPNNNTNPFDCFTTCKFGNCLNGECINGELFSIQFFASFGFLMSTLLLVPLFVIILIILIVLLAKMNNSILKEGLPNIPPMPQSIPQPIIEMKEMENNNNQPNEQLNLQIEESIIE